jgi:hypothetical protein
MSDANGRNLLKTFFKSRVAAYVVLTLLVLLYVFDSAPT